MKEETYKEKVMDLLKCQTCGAALQEGQKFCPNCGAPVPAPILAPSMEERMAELEQRVTTLEERVNATAMNDIAVVVPPAPTPTLMSKIQALMNKYW